MKIKKVSGTAVLNGNVVDSLEDNSTINAPSQRAVNELKGKVLWTNPNPTSEMIADTLINLSSDDYDKIEWIYCYNINEANTKIHHSSNCLKGNSAMLNITGYASGLIMRRILDYVSDTQYKARIGVNSSTNEVDAVVCIPQ